MADEPTTKPELNGAAVSDDLIVPLRKPVQAHGEEIKELKFREPTAGDIEVCGTPVMIQVNSGEDAKITFETKAMFAMMSRLANVPPSTIKSMSTKDWEFAALALAHRFFYPVVMEGDITISDLVLDCYRLAKYYGRNPVEFLNMPFSEVHRHITWTSRLEKILRPTRDDG